MAGISIYNCNKCEAFYIEHHGFPYHKDQETQEYKFFPVPVGPEIRASGLIDGYKYVKYCLECKKDVHIFLDNEQKDEVQICPSCLKSDTFLGSGSLCPTCNEGLLEFNEGSQVLF